MTFNAEDMPTEDELREKLVAQIEHGYNKINEKIDDLTSAELKRVLKAITYVHQAGHLLYNEEIELSEEESQLIDNIYSFQEPILMLQHDLMAKAAEEGELDEQVD